MQSNRQNSWSATVVGYATKWGRSKRSVWPTDIKLPKKISIINQNILKTLPNYKTVFKFKEILRHAYRSVSNNADYRSFTGEEEETNLIDSKKIGTS